MEIRYFESIDSTQKRVLDDIRQQKITPPICYYTNKQTDGIGSRNNRWIGLEGNMFFSFALYQKNLPQDLPLASVSLYFSFLFKEILCKYDARIWLKWPNDFYIGKKKCGGCVTNKVGDMFVCGIGINTKQAPPMFEKVSLQIEEKKVLEEYFSLIKRQISWKEIFRKFALEFYKSKEFITHYKGQEIDLKNAQLAEDGALMINGERIYSLR
ncbi:biotin--[acetyl-CoA-carboxylase] ligase [Nitratiruptor tergarcus]|uniref:BirA family transcriptional regulator, biotin operon repressor / biotin-[acetyl-CoA-carboxylase] ligase n=1 Tax=Nitratiruptor tergarcus DSM 16512 TaxID=1069081 RepID=A0A1W1WUN0_9BACT|nr:biotin--[acetyl-CoA-carboxylase] ligase [Nitratiruptor tergarcus]SMC09946.1 BirA family transcriptional regulator, biotin operon repressor / biotin-[acetyl-CoA-carboxylase] ligase [Nitratiruptor tergarcus DSM 16512]